MRRTLAWFSALMMLPSAGAAVSTRSFVVDTAEGFEKGTLKGTAAHSNGRLTRALHSARTAIEGAPVAYASTSARDGTLYVATGNEGAIYRVDRQGAVKLFADTPAALVTSLVWIDGTLYAGTLPEARVFAIAEDGKVREYAKLGADHVWALAYAEKQRTLYAATGPEGKLFAIDLKTQAPQARVVHDDEAEHLLCLGLDREQRLYVGTSNGARLLRVAGSEVSVAYDFPGQELTALSVGGSFVAVAANEFPPPPAPTGDAKDLGALARTKRVKPGKGTVYALGMDGNVQELGQFDSAHVSALEVDEASDAVHAGLAQEGRIVRLARNGERAVWADVDERQIVAIHLRGPTPHFLSSDGVALYRVREPESDGEWTSAVLDAKAPARFGELTFRARGAVKLATRSGNTETPDKSWSSWSAESAVAAPIRSPRARFLQLRARLHGDAELYAVEAYYLPQNLPPRLRNVRLKGDRGEAGALPLHQTTLALSWDVDNPDEDKLRYRLYVRREGQTAWQPLLREHELLEQAEYTWETRSMPDGYYRVRVLGSDEASNPEPYATSAEAISAPLLVDNRAPEVLDLKSESGRVTGRALDALGPVARLDYAIDAAPYRPLFPSDDLLDTREERFSFALPKLAPGVHTVAVRALDAAANQATAALEVNVR